MYPQETIEKFLQLSKQGAIQGIDDFIAKFDSKSLTTFFGNMLNSSADHKTSEGTLYHFLHQHAVEAIHGASSNGHSETVLFLLNAIADKAPDLQLGLNDFIQLLQNAISRGFRREIDYLCNLIFKATNAEEIARQLWQAMPDVVNLDFTFRTKQTTVLVRIFRSQFYELALDLAKNLDLEILLKRDARFNSALTSAIAFSMEEVSSTILQRISGNHDAHYRCEDFYEWGLIGKGGFAEVYKVKDKKGNWIALKKACNPKHIDLYVKEMQILSELHDYNIVQCMGAFVSMREIYLVLTYAAGINLLQFYREHLVNMQDAEEHYRIVADIAYKMREVLSILYLYLVIHLDIKMENVIIECRNGEVNLTLVDFALSIKTNEDHIGMLDDLAGTLGCMAPEIAVKYHDLLNKKASVPVSPKADVFSNGIMIFDLLSRVPGRYLFINRREIDTLRATIVQEHNWSSSLMAPMYAGLRTYVDNSLIKKEDLRLNAAELPDPRVPRPGI